MTTNPTPQKKLQRSDDRIIAGVCSGLAEYLNIDTTVVRVIFAVLTVFGGGGILLYLVAWLVMPDSSGTVAAGKLVQRATRSSQPPAQEYPPASGQTPGASTSHEPPAA